MAKHNFSVDLHLFKSLEKFSVFNLVPYRPKVELRKSVVSKYQLSPQGGDLSTYKIPEEQTHLVAGSDVILECIAKEGYPGAKFEWFKNGRPVRRPTSESFNRSKLKLINIQRVDQGVYKCFASNILGQHEKKIVVKLR